MSPILKWPPVAKSRSVDSIHHNSKIKKYYLFNIPTVQVIYLSDNADIKRCGGDGRRGGEDKSEILFISILIKP